MYVRTWVQSSPRESLQIFNETVSTCVHEYKLSLGSKIVVSVIQWVHAYMSTNLVRSRNSGINDGVRTCIHEYKLSLGSKIVVSVTQWVHAYMSTNLV